MRRACSLPVLLRYLVEIDGDCYVLSPLFIHSFLSFFSSSSQESSFSFSSFVFLGLASSFLSTRSRLSSFSTLFLILIYPSAHVFVFLLLVSLSPLSKNFLGTMCIPVVGGGFSYVSCVVLPTLLRTTNLFGPSPLDPFVISSCFS